MTCVLSMPALYANPFNEVGADIQNNGCESLDYNWITPHHPHSGLSNFQRCLTPCHVEASTGSSIVCRMEISDAPGRVKHEHVNVCGEEDHESDIKEIDIKNHVPTNGTKCVPEVSEIGNKLDDLEPGHMHIHKHGVKRKAEVTESEEVYIPSKRVSPFLNTPKERKDERKKVLKISLKKLKQLDDPEAFLRRTVLVNNLTNRLQSELRKEKLRAKKRKSRKSFSGYGVNNNNCMSDMYLFDDPFLSGGVHEKITDDMTDTLINNVLHETNDRTAESGIGEKLELKSNEMEVPDEQMCVDSRTFTALNSIEYSSDQSSCDESATVLQSSKESNPLICLDNGRDTQEKCVVGSDELKVVKRNMNTVVERFKSIHQENSETLNSGEWDTKLIEHREMHSTELQNVHSDLNMECDKLHPDNLVNVKKSINLAINCTDTVQNYICTDKNNSYSASKVTEHKWSSNKFELDQQLNQKSLLHSFNIFLAYTES